MLQDIFRKPGSHSPDASNFPQLLGRKYIHVHIHMHIEHLQSNTHVYILPRGPALLGPLSVEISVPHPSHARTLVALFSAMSSCEFCPYLVDNSHCFVHNIPNQVCAFV